MSIANAEETKRSPAPVLDVLDSADGLMKLAMRLDELNGGVSRLERAGYVTLHDDLSLSLTPTGKAIIEQAHPELLAGARWWTVIERILGAAPQSPDDDWNDAGDGRELISDESLRKAEKARRKQRRKARREERRRQSGEDTGAG